MKYIKGNIIYGFEIIDIKNNTIYLKYQGLNYIFEIKYINGTNNNLIDLMIENINIEAYKDYERVN